VAANRAGSAVRALQALGVAAGGSPLYDVSTGTPNEENRYQPCSPLRVGDPRALGTS
jgi:hypothetical protein